MSCEVAESVTGRAGGKLRGWGVSAQGLGCGERKRGCGMPSAAARGRKRMGRAAERNVWVGAVGGGGCVGKGSGGAESAAVVVVVSCWHAGAGGFATTHSSSAPIDVFETSVTALSKLGPRLRSRVRSEGALRR